MIEQDIKQQLISSGIGTDTTIVLGQLPSTPDNLISVATSNSVLTNNQNTLTDQAIIPFGICDVQETISITVRNTDYSAGHSIIWQIYNLLVGERSGYVVCNNRQMFVFPVQPPYSMAVDNNRNCFTFDIVANTSRNLA